MKPLIRCYISRIIYEYMGKLKRSMKRGVRGVSRLVPRSSKNIIRNIFAELSGTREMRDFFRQYYGDYKVYEELLKNKSDVTEYHVDKMIRSVGKQLTDLQAENIRLSERVRMLEEAAKQKRG